MREGRTGKASEAACSAVLTEPSVVQRPGMAEPLLVPGSESSLV